MLKIENRLFVSGGSIEREYGLNPNHMPFAEMTENDSYRSFDLSSAHLEDLQDLLGEWEGYSTRIKPIQDEIKLYHILKELCGDADAILIYISW